MRITAVLFACLLLAACDSASTDGSGAAQGRATCAAVLSLKDNAADFGLISSARTQEEAIAAIDRIEARTSSAIDDLRSVGAGPIGDQARAVAAIQQRLFPVLDMYRNIGDQASWTAARSAYTDWYNDSTVPLSDIANRLDGLGVRCTG